MAHTVSERTAVPPLLRNPSSEPVREAVARRFRELIATVDIPQSPPPFLRSGAPVGLELLDLILEPRHVVRLSENLAVSRVTHVQRDLIVDISLARLTTSQMRSAHLYSAYRTATGVRGITADGRRKSEDTPEAHSTDHNTQISIPGFSFPAKETAIKPMNASAPSHAGQFPRLWLPILQISNQESALVQVRSSGGELLPKATKAELTPVLTAGLIHLFTRECDRLLERGSEDPAAVERIRSVRYEREFARWLIWRAIETLLREGIPPDPTAPARPSSFRRVLSRAIHLGPRNQVSGGVTSPSFIELSDPDRELAAYVGSFILKAGVLGPLLALAATSHFVVVGVASNEEEQSLEVSTPRLQIDNGLVATSRHGRYLPHLLLFARRLSKPRRHWLHFGALFQTRGPAIISAPVGIWKRLQLELSRYQAVTFRYRTPVPSVATSYHLYVRCDDDLTIENALLLSNEDQVLLHELGDRAEFAKRSVHNLAEGKPEDSDALLPVLRSHLLDAEHLVDQLLALVAARQHEASRAHPQANLVRPHAELARPLQTVAAMRLRELREQIVDLQTGYRRLRDTIAGGAADTQAAARTYFGEADSLATQLVAACEQSGPGQLDIGMSLRSDDDPRESEAHLHRQEHRRRRGQQLGVHEATVLVEIRESTPALRGRVLATVGPLAFLVYIIAAVSFDSWNWLRRAELAHADSVEADALITVLLLVPGLLISRLEVARGTSLVAVIRAFPRFVAYSSVACTTFLAAIVASGAEGHLLYVSFVACFLALIVLFLIQLVDVTAAQWASRSNFAVDIPTMPIWLVYPGLAQRRHDELDIDVRSDSGAMS